MLSAVKLNEHDVTKADKRSFIEKLSYSIQLARSIKFVNASQARVTVQTVSQINQRRIVCLK